MLNIVVPMAGAGSRFSRAGFVEPKPLIPIHGVPMIRFVIGNLQPQQPHRFLFIVQRAHAASFDLHRRLDEWAPGCGVIELDGLTEGAACTVLAASAWIDNDDSLMIANSDQYVACDMAAYLAQAASPELDGLVMTMRAHDPKWSYVGLDSLRHVTHVVEKQVISDEATVGIYNFRRGCDFVRAARGMIARDERVNGEFYVAPVYNSLIEQGAQIGIYNVGEERAGMYGLGIPDDLEHFSSLDLSVRAAEALR